MFDRLNKFFFRIRHYLFNTSWIMAEKLLVIGATFFITLLVARYLGPEKYGLLAYAISLNAIFGIAGHAGLSGLVVRELVKKTYAHKEIIGTSFLMKGAGYSLSLLLLVIFAFVSEDVGSSSFWIVIILATSLLFRPFDIIDFWFQSRLEAKYSAIARVCGLIVSALAKISLIAGGAQLIAFAGAHILQVVVAAAVFVLLYRLKSKFSPLDWSVSLQRARNLFSEGWMVFLGSIFAVMYLKSDQVMLRWMIGEEEVGLYAVAATLSEAWYFIPTAIIASFFPKLINLRKDNSVMYNAALQRIYDFLFIVAFVIAVLVNIFALPVITLMFGEAYAESAGILVIHIWASIFIFMRAAFSKWILIEGLLMFSLVTQGMGAVTNILLNLLLIPSFGGIGAAYATLFSYAMASYFALFFHPKTRPAFCMMSKSFVLPIRRLFRTQAF